MLDAISSLGSQLRDGFAVARSIQALPSSEGVRAVAVCGMGGSGIAGDVVRAAFARRLAVPVAVVKGYSLPAFCDRDTLVLAASFSGNTEETLAAYVTAVARGCRVVAYAAGGELAALAEGDDVPFVQLPSSVEMPRAALGWLAATPIGVLDAMGLVSPMGEEVSAAAATLEDLSVRLGPDVPTERNEAKSMVSWLGERVPLIWGSEGAAEVAALRWKSQFNENAKTPAFSGVMPELGHNEVEGWPRDSGHRFAVIVLRHPDEPASTEERLRATMEALAPSGLEFRQVRASDRPALASLFALIVVGDFASTYAGLARGVDPSPVPVLTSLKDRLAAARTR
jgi:glucose/mannose-6-phosphate isomerase